jgi:membrane-bound metal-dependent hydrolase YbcI (DUF457 family)
MPLAVTHVLTGIISVDLYRDYLAKHKKYFTVFTVFLAGFFSLLPDFDILIRMIGDLFHFGLPTLLQHGGITHTPFFASLFLLPALILWRNKKKRKEAACLFIAAYAIMLHIFLDYLLGGGAYEGVMWLFPFSTSAWKLHLLAYGLANIPEALDALILLAWLWHEEVKHKISDFI